MTHRWIGCWLGLLALAAPAILAVPGCGSQEPPFGNAPVTTPVATSGRGVLSGVCMTTRDECAENGAALIQVINAQGLPVFQEMVPIGGQYQAQLLPGSYTLQAQALPCLFSQSFTIALGDAMIVNTLLF